MTGRTVSHYEILEELSEGGMGCCVSSWCATHEAIAATIASSPPTSPSGPPRLEVCFRDVKQLPGFENPRNRVSKATQRTAPLAFCTYDLALLWYARCGHRVKADSLLPRTWYRQKDSVSFEDVLRALRYATWQERIFGDPALDPHARKILQPLIEWVKGVA